MRRHIVITFETQSCAYVRGYGSRALIEELRGRPPVWATRSRAWAVQPKTARDLVSLAETRGYAVDVTREDALTPRQIADLDEVTPPKATLW